MNTNSIPIIAIDGTSSSGKGTVARKLAKHFGYYYLNSGALYRLTAYTASKNNIDLKNTNELINAVINLSPSFNDEKVLIDGADVWPIISTQEYGNLASKIAVIPEVRVALYELERKIIKLPGLVAEGRDMGTFVFTDAKVKIYLDAEIKIRAERKTKDEKINNSGKSYEEIFQELVERDARDKTRDVGPLYRADDAKIIDTSNNTIEETFNQCLKYCEEKGIK